jgi:hypothetical protein
MVLFYETKNEGDLERVEGVLRGKGIEYTLRREPEQGLAPCRIYVAEEDIPEAQEILAKLSH